VEKQHIFFLLILSNFNTHFSNELLLLMGHNLNLAYFPTEKLSIWFLFPSFW